MSGLPFDLVLQHAAVTLVAAGAFGVLVRKVTGIFRPRPSGPAAGCSKCASGAQACGTTGSQPVAVLRPTRN